MKAEDKKAVVNNYETLLGRYGADPRSLQWPNRTEQEVRFRVLSEIAPLKNKRIFDFGCGMGDLYYYLKRRGVPTRYTGYDLSREMIRFARSRDPRLDVHARDLFRQKPRGPFDYALVSGTFNNKMSDNWGFLFKTLRALWPLCREGLGFNLITTYVDYKEPHLFYADPKRTLDWVKRHLTRFVTLRNDYRPFDYTVYCYRNARG